MKRAFTFFLPPALALMGLTLCCTLLWSQTVRFRNSVEDIAEDVRVSLIDLEGKVVYDSTGKSLPNHSARAEFEAVLADGKARSIVRESETLHMAMFYHARRVGDYVLRIAVPYQAVTDAKIYAQRGLLAAIGLGALVVLALFFFMRRNEQRLARLSSERDLKDKLLAEMRKLESFRRDFIANVSHEIKTPVTGIIGAVEILADESATLDGQDYRDLQKVLRDQSKRLNTLVEDILSLSHLEKAESDSDLTFTNCNLADIVQTAINLAHPLADKAGIQLIFQKKDVLSDYIRPCDPRLIESALSNLIHNALRHSGSKTVEIVLKKMESGKVSIRVIDYGMGIPVECQARLFERFYRVDKNRSRALGGTGLGLSIVKHIVQLHRGSVSVTSAPNHGSTFEMTI